MNYQWSVKRLVNTPARQGAVVLYRLEGDDENSAPIQVFIPVPWDDATDRVDARRMLAEAIGERAPARLLRQRARQLADRERPRTRIDTMLEAVAGDVVTEPEDDDIEPPERRRSARDPQIHDERERTRR